MAGWWSYGTNFCKVYEAETGRELFKLDLPSEGARVTFSPDSKRMVTTCTNGTAAVWDASTGRPLRMLDLGTDYGSGDVALRP